MPIAVAPPAFDRDVMLERLRRETFDVLVVGGGITGVGVALDAAARGLRVALVERDDLASGTSSRSSKLVHGGLRYLQNGDVRLVHDALRERQRLLRNAPHLVEVLPFLIPVLTHDGVISRRLAKALGSAMWMYDLAGGWRIGRRHRKLDADQTRAHVPTLPHDRVAGGYLYFDATADDARLTLAVARTAAAHGAAIATRCRVVGLTPTTGDGPVDSPADSPVDGAVVDTGDGEIRVRSKVVVSATGVWADELDRLDRPGRPPSIRPAKGVHVTVPWELVRNDVAVVVPVPGDKRSLFVVPSGPRGDGTHRHAYIGTTDTDHEGTLDEPQCDADDLEYVLGALNQAIDLGGQRPIGTDDVTGVWAGLRPLVASGATGRTADLSRTHRISVSDRGVVTIAGGKLTTYRAMAEDTVDTVEEMVRHQGDRHRPWYQPWHRWHPWRRLRRSPTRRLRLVGATRDLGDASTRAGHLRRRYGTEADDVLNLIDHDPSLGASLVPGLPHLRAEAIHAVRHEMATTLDDVLVRRTRCHLFDRDATEVAAPEVAALLGRELGWTNDELERQVASYRALCERERHAAREHRPVSATGATA
ncbi:MAG: glycerol-3-phosphate dehydrogenase/oxidase [Ilumatobacteraceae bacterium]